MADEEKDDRFISVMEDHPEYVHLIGMISIELADLEVSFAASVARMERSEIRGKHAGTIARVPLRLHTGYTLIGTAISQRHDVRCARGFRRCDDQR